MDSVPAAAEYTMPSDSDLPRISVLIPWISGRGKALRTVESWTRSQTCPPKASEIILATVGSAREVRSTLHGLVDNYEIRILERAGRSYPEQINACARHARAPWILITELHVEARPDCLLRILAWIQDQSEGLAGAPIEIFSKHQTLAGRMESALYQAASHGWHDPTHWHGVRVRGTALRRRFFLDRGGFNPQYELACDIAFGLEALKDGHRFGRVTPICADHWENTTLRGVFGDAYTYSRGEAAFRLYGPPGLTEEYLGVSEVFQKGLTQTQSWRRVQLRLGSIFLWKTARFLLARSPEERLGQFRAAFVCVMELGRCSTLSKGR